MRIILTGMMTALALHAAPAEAAGAAPKSERPASGNAVLADAASGQPLNRPVTATSRPPLEWPGEIDREALVYLRICLTETGKTSEITVSDQGFGEKRFVNAALANARRTSFRPAIVDGKPVATCVVQPFGFRAAEDEQGRSKWAVVVSEEFRAEIAKVDEFFKQRDYAGANFHAEYMLREKVRYGYEYATLKAQLAQTQALVGLYVEALGNAAEATKNTVSTSRKLTLHQPIPSNNAANYLLPKDLTVQLLGLRMKLATQLGELPAALTAYYEMAGLVDMQPDDPRVVLAANLTAKLASADPLVIAGSIPVKAWTHTLFRNRFTLDKVRGGVHSLSLRCGGKNQELRYAPGEEWTVPVDWEDCATVTGVTIEGDPGTSFHLIELAK